MAITVNTNIPSLVAQKCLNNASDKMNTAMQRMSTGLRINSAKDDAAGSAVATKLDYKISSLSVAQDNAQMGTSLLQTTEGTLDVIQSNMQRIRDLTEQAANGTYGTDAMTAIKSEVGARLREITRMSNTAEFNGKKVLDGSCDDINLQVGIESNSDSIISLDKEIFSSTAATKLLDIYGDAANDDDKHKYNFNVKTTLYKDPDSTDLYAKVNNDFIKVEKDGTNKSVYHPTFKATATDPKSYADCEFANSDAELLARLKRQDPYVDDAGTTDPTDDISEFTLSLKSDDAVAMNTGTTDEENQVIDSMMSWVYANDSFAQKFLDNIDSAIAEVTTRKTELGAAMQRINSAVDVAKTMETNLTDAVSLIKDADIAEESSNYVKNQILQQSAASLLATANQTPQIALQLI